jgi:hypothetical protein
MSNITFFDATDDGQPQSPDEKKAEEWAGYAADAELHYGPGPHKSGSSQDVHGDREGADGADEKTNETRTALPDIPTRNIIDRAIAGGFTYQPFTEEYPTTGYVYSIWTDREKVIPLDDVTSETLEEYVISNADLLTQENHYFGGWVENGQLYLDVSKREENLETALKEANDTKQLAIFNLDALETIYTDYYYENVAEAEKESA